MIRWLIAVLLSCSFSTAAIAASAVTGPEVYGFRVEKISKDDDAYRQGNIYLLTGPDGQGFKWSGCYCETGTGQEIKPAHIIVCTE